MVILAKSNHTIVSLFNEYNNTHHFVYYQHNHRHKTRQLNCIMIIYWTEYVCLFLLTIRVSVFIWTHAFIYG